MYCAKFAGLSFQAQPPRPQSLNEKISLMVDEHVLVTIHIEITDRFKP